jgi:hypothetical protein
MVEQAPAVAASASASRGEQQLLQQQWQQHRLPHSPAHGASENAFEEKFEVPVHARVAFWPICGGWRASSGVPPNEGRRGTEAQVLRGR